MIHTIVGILSKSQGDVIVDGVELGRFTIFTNGQIYDHKRGYFKKHLDNGNGYKVVGFYTKSGETVIKYVHRLVCEAFLGRCEHRTEVNHKNGVKSDNHLGNLEWVTSSENSLHSSRNGRLNRWKVGKKFNPMEDDVKREAIRMLCSDKSVREVGEELGRSRTTISSLYNGRSSAEWVLEEMGKVCCLSDGCRCSKYARIVSERVGSSQNEQTNK